MKRMLLIFALIFIGNLLIKHGNNINVFIGVIIMFFAGSLAGYADGFKRGKRYILTGNKK